MIRDIPTASVVAGGAKISNLRQIVSDQMKKEGLECRCIRCREVKEDFNKDDKPEMFRLDYEASNGKEIFLSIETNERKKLFSILPELVQKWVSVYELCTWQARFYTVLYL